MAEDFFGDLSKSLSSAAHQAVDKTSTFFEAQKMSVQIQTLKREVDKLHQRIGEAIVKEVSDGTYAPSDAVQALLDEVADDQDKIEGLRKSIANIRGQKICASCGSVIDASHAYCPKCGAQAPVDAPEPDPVDVEVCECSCVCDEDEGAAAEAEDACAGGEAAEGGEDVVEEETTEGGECACGDEDAAGNATDEGKEACACTCASEEAKDGDA